MTVAQYLARLAAEATTIINAADYGRTVYDLAIRRDLIQIGEDMVNVAFDAPVDFAPREQIEDAEQRLYDLAEIGRYGGGFQKFETALTTARRHGGARLSARRQAVRPRDRPQGSRQQDGRPAVVRPDHRRRPPRHGQDRARHQHRLQRRARAGAARCSADGHIETVNGGIVGFFSLEMSAEQLATRIIAEQSGIPSSTIRRGGINERDFEKIKDVAIELQHLPFFIDETGGLTVAQLAARARRLKRQKGLDLLVIDYIQLLQGSSRRSQENRVQEVTEITTNLKALAKELNVPIMALSQLSRQVENRDDKRPQLSDLRESGSIEQDADVVMFVFREEYYLSNKEPRPGTDEHHQVADRDGPRSTARPRSSSASSATARPAPSICSSTAPVTRFDNLAHEDSLAAALAGPDREPAPDGSAAACRLRLTRAMRGHRHWTDAPRPAINAAS